MGSLQVRPLRKKIITIEEARQNMVAMYFQHGGLPYYIQVLIFDSEDDERNKSGNRYTEE